MMQATLDLFQQNIERSRDLTAIFRVLSAQTTTALDLTDVLRSGLVMSVSALDHFIHEIVRLGMLEVYRGERTATPAFLRFQVTLEGVLEAVSAPNSGEWLESQIRERHGHQSFQTPNHVAEAVRLISDVMLWNEVAASLGMNRQDVTETLNLIVQRRNSIAHEADIMPDYAGQIAYSSLRSPIDETLVDNAANFIERVAEAIYDLVALTNPVTSTN